MRFVNLSIVVSISLVVGCGEDTFGTGIGRRTVEVGDVPRPTLVPLKITEVFVNASVVADQFAEVFHTGSPGDVFVDLSGFELCDSAGCVGFTDANLDAGNRTTEPIASLNLNGNVGELALVDADGVVHDHFAWGASPSVIGSSLAADAVAVGAVPAGAFVPLPYPAPANVAVIREDAGEGCADASENDPGNVDAALCPAQPVMIEMTELLPELEPPEGETAGESWVEIVSRSSEELSLWGVRLCQMPTCAVFARDAKLAAGARMLVYFGLERPDGNSDPAEVYFPDVAGIRATGELALLAPGSTDVTDPEAFQSFVRFGQTGGGLSDGASASPNNIWSEPLDSASPPRIVGESLSLDLSAEHRGSAWNPTTATPLAANPDVGPATGIWTSCSYPRPWNTVVVSELAISRIANTIPATIELLNRGSTDVALDAFTLRLGAARRALGDHAINPLPANGRIVVELDPSGDGCVDTNLCFPGAMLAVEGEASLLEDIGGTPMIRQYLQWRSFRRRNLGDDRRPAVVATYGQRGTGSTRNTAAAVAANLWPLTTCAVPALEADGVISLVSGADGQSPPDYR